jgi:penicillin-binding protein 1C
LRRQLKHRLLKPGITLCVILMLFFVLDFILPVDYERNYSSSIYDRNGNLLHGFLSNDDKWRMYCELDEISDQLKRTILFKEDKYFYYHPGINIFAVGRAAFNNLIKKRRTSGASTITMQVARLLEPKNRTYRNKVIEMFRALQLEWHLSKEEILQLYLNLVPMGGNIEGIKAASYLYFNKAPDHLSLAEIVTLSIIPNRPVSLRIGNSNQLIEMERNKWLGRIKASALFERETVEDALSEPLNAGRLEIPRQTPHLAYRLKKNFPNKHIIRSTIDLNMQLKIENLVKSYSHQLYFRGIHNATLVVIDNKTRQILSYIGSSDYTSTLDGGQVDGITALRSPGSTLKPFLYAQAMDLGLITPKQKLLDVPSYFRNYEPENYDGKFYGEVSMEFALVNSLNVPAVRMLDKVGVEDFVELLASAGLRGIDVQRDRLGLSVILGGCGVTLEELTLSYCGIANLGRFTRPRYLLEDTVIICDSLLSASSSFAISEILTNLTRPDLPADWKNTLRMPKIAWKTGTSYGRRDAWSIGFNQEYTVGVWCGNFSGTGVPDLSGSEIATPLLLKTFNAITEDQSNEWLLPPDELDYRIVCSSSGMVPGSHCTDKTIDYFMPEVSSIKKCTHLKSVGINPDTTISYCYSCLPENGYKKALFPDYSIELLSFYQSNSIPYVKIPLHNPLCERLQSDNGPIINSPIDGMDYMLAKDDSEQLMLSCKTTDDVNIVYWSVNDRFVKSGAAGETIFITPPAGKLKISCADDKGRNRDAFILVKYIEF